MSESSLPLKILFELISIKNVLFIYRALLLEHKDLLVSTQLSCLAEVAEGFLNIMFPFELLSSYCPLVPEDVLDILELPQCYFMGVPAVLVPPLDPKIRDIPSHLHQYPSDVVVLNIDADSVHVGRETIPIPPFPSR